MKITQITQQVKRTGRYSVYVDDKFAFGVGEGQLLKLGLHNGKEITKSELEELKGEAETGKLFDKTLNLLSIRARSEWELRDYLRRKKAEPEQIEKILNKLSELGYVDDGKFAKRWVENRRLLKPTSNLKLRAELKQKHIANEHIESALAESSTDENTALKQIIEKKASRYPDRQKLMQYLARQGFRYEDIKNALSEMQ